MENEKEVKKKSKSKLIIIILLVVIIAIVAASAFFIISDKSFKDIKASFVSQDEYTLLLDEFVTNLQTEQKGKNYLKIQVALMYKDKKNIEIIDSNLNKIRDIVLNDLREKTPEQILKVEETPEVKKQLIKKLNDSLGKDIIKEVYFTNLIVQ